MTQPIPPTPPTPPTPPLNTLESSPIPEVKLDTTPQNYYQAIGWLRGKLVQVEERFQIQIKDALFPLYLPRKVIAVANNHIDQIVWIKCYPQSKGEGLSFKGVWMGTEQAEKGEAGIFVLRGVWQFIPQCRRPVFTIYRNELKDYENRPSNQHLPLIWADQPPYRFRKDSEEKPKFYQITARLIPQRACFGFVSQIADPQDFTPRRMKKPPMDGHPAASATKSSTLTEKPRSKSKEKAPAEVETPAKSESIS
jgi:hypothetical protein